MGFGELLTLKHWPAGPEREDLLAGGRMAQTG
jgi:hypothetical protein